MSEFKKYKRTNVAEMRPYIKGEDLSDISVSNVDDPENDMGMIARNPQNHSDMWYVARKYFIENFEEFIECDPNKNQDFTKQQAEQYNKFIDDFFYTTNL